MGLRWLGGALQIAGVVTVALTVSSVRRALGMDGIVAAAVRRAKGIFAEQRYPGKGGKRRRWRQHEQRDRWPDLNLIWPRKGDDRPKTLRREVTGHFDHMKRLQEELRRQRESDQKELVRLVEQVELLDRRVEKLDRHVVKVVGGGTRIEAVGVVAFVLGIALSAVAPELCGVG